MGKDFWAQARLEKERKENTVKVVKRIVREQRLPTIVDLAVEASPAFKSDKLKERIADALKVLAVTHDPHELQEALFESKAYREEKFGSPWELPVFIAQGIVLDLLAGRDIDKPTASDVRNSVTIYNTVLKYIPSGSDMKEFDTLKYRWLEKMIARHPELN